MADVTAETASFTEKHHFLIRRLHSLSGIIPVGVFLCIHMLLNVSIVAGESAFQTAVNLVHSLDKVGVLKIVEVFFIFIPIAFHALVGILIWLTSKPNTLEYRYGGNIRYTLQRWTALITVVFILGHLWHMHWLGSWLPLGAQFDPHDAGPSAVAAIDMTWWFIPIYAIGVIAAVYHFANGIWTFLIVWGITVGPRAQRGAGYACALVGIFLAVCGLGALTKLAVSDVPEKSGQAPAVETHTAATEAETQPDFWA